ncbi:multiple monosaccharide ABC transporter permease [Bordetella muralis]|uniref:multiple monosaccharide ABC transporter permease n=1 Tax=Bordetella muralis TaxID=1649130 RepID=UPI0039F1295B
MNTSTSLSAPGGNRNSVGAYFAKHVREYGLLIALVAILIMFQVLTDGTLMRPVNITNLLLQNSYIVIMALGMLMVIVSGHIDLSVGSVMGFVGALAAVLIVQQDWPVWTAVPACLLAGMAIGAVQGYFIAFWKIPAFIVTLAGMLIFRGLSLWLLQGQSVGPFPRDFQLLSTGFVPDLFGAGKPNVTALIVGIVGVALLMYSSCRAWSRNRRYGIDAEPLGFFVGRLAIISVAILFFTWKLAGFRGLPNVLLSMGILTAIYVFITEKTTLGRRIYALGGNEKAARISGIKTERLTFLTFVNMGFLAALAGLIFAARLNTATPKAGFGLELDVIAAVFIGGASASGGTGKIIGAVVGAFIMGVMNNGMSILGIGIDYQQVIKGCALLAAVFFDVYNRRRQS